MVVAVRGGRRRHRGGLDDSGVLLDGETVFARTGLVFVGRAGTRGRSPVLDRHRVRVIFCGVGTVRRVRDVHFTDVGAQGELEGLPASSSGDTFIGF